MNVIRYNINNNNIIAYALFVFPIQISPSAERRISARSNLSGTIRLVGDKGRRSTRPAGRVCCSASFLGPAPRPGASRVPRGFNRVIKYKSPYCFKHFNPRVYCGAVQVQCVPINGDTLNDGRDYSKAENDEFRKHKGRF